MISVIIPVYNTEKYLDECLESLLGQTYQAFELIVIDDGSTDASGKLCDLWAERDSRIRVFHQENQGLAAVRNRGLELAQGEYIAWVDSDDYVDSHYLEKMIKVLQDEETDMVMCSFFTNTDGEVRHTGRRLFQKEKMDRQTYLERLYTYGLYSVVWNKLVTSDKYENIQFPMKRVFEDASVMCQLTEKCNRITVIEEPLYFYRRHNDAITVQKLDEKKSIKYVSDFYEWLKNDIELHRKNGNMKLVALASRHLCDTILRYSEGIQKRNQGKWRKIYKECGKEILCCKDFSVITKLKYLVGWIDFFWCRQIIKGVRKSKDK